MDNRQLIAYALIALIGLFLTTMLFLKSRDWRGHRRASRDFERRQRERRSGQPDEPPSGS
jgi:hypothetical protein